MKQILIKCFKDGTSTITPDSLFFDSENETTEVTIDYSATDFATWDKQADIFIGNDKTTDFVTDTSGEGSFSFNLTSAMLKKGYLRIQPIAKETQEDSTVHVVKWATTELKIRTSLNVSESTTSVSTTLGEQLQADIDAIELDIGDTDTLTTTSKEIVGAINEVNAVVNGLEPRYNDIVFEFTPTRVNPTTTRPVFDFVNNGLLFPQNNTSEAIYITVQLPHSWKVGTTIYPHVHVVQSRNEQAVFKMDYKWYDIGDEIPTDWLTYVMDTYATDYVSGSISQICKGTGIDGTGKGISSILKVKLYRDDNVYVGDILADQFDIHIEVDGFGSQEEYVKT